jgi:hypothetical protein
MRRMTGKRTASVKYDCVDTFISKWIKVAHWFSRLKFIFFWFFVSQSFESNHMTRTDGLKANGAIVWASDTFLIEIFLISRLGKTLGTCSSPADLPPGQTKTGFFPNSSSKTTRGVERTFGGGSTLSVLSSLHELYLLYRSCSLAVI